MKKHLFSLVLFSLLLTTTMADAQSWLWARGTGRICTGQSNCNAITTDPANNVYISAQYGDSLYLGSYTFFQPFLSAVPSIWQSCLAKYDTGGNLLWAKVPTAGLAQTWSIKMGPDHYLYTMGTYHGSILSFGTSGSTITAPDAAPYHYFIAKFDASGNAVWTKNIGDGFYAFAFNFRIANNLDCDKWGGIYVTADFLPAVFHVGPYTLVNQGIEDVFVAKFDTAGNVIWAKDFGGGGEEAPHALAVSSAGSVYVTGYYSSATFHVSPVYSLNFTSTFGAAQYDAFLVKLDTGGNVLWARSPTNGCNSIAVTTDQNDNAVIGGLMDDQVVGFGPYTVFDFFSTSPAHAAFLAKYDPNGSPMWANSFYSDAGITNVFSLQADNCNHIWAAGSWGWGPGIGHTLYYNSSTSASLGYVSPNPMFFMHLDPSGTLIDHQEFPSGFQTGLACSSTGDLLLSGEYFGPLGFGSESVIPGSYLFFLAKYRPASLQPAPITGPVHLCQGSSSEFSDATPTGTWSSSNLSIAQVIATTGAVTGLLAGTASISYTLPNGCSSVVAPFTVDVPIPASVNLTATLPDGSRAPDTLCLGQTVIFKTSPVNAGTVPLLQWYLFGSLKSSGLDTVTTGTDSFVYSPVHGDVIYCKMVVDSVCAVSDTVTEMMTFDVDSNKSPLITIAKSADPDTVSYMGQVINFFSTVQYGGIAPTYQWYKNDTLVPGATLPYYATAVYANDTVYCVVTGNTRCGINPTSATSNKIYIYNPLAVNSLSHGDNTLTLFPNPSNGTLLLSGTINATSNISTEISDMLGRVVYRNTAVAINGQIHEQITLDKKIADGAYLLHVRSDAGNEVFHFVIAR